MKVFTFIALEDMQSRKNRTQVKKGEAMLEFIKKATLAGVGAAALTAEKAEEIGTELITKGKMTEKEGCKFVEELQKKATESRDAIKEQTEHIVKETLKKMNLAKADDVQSLKEEIENLRTELHEIKNK